MTKLEEILADYFVDKGMMKRISCDSQHVEVEYEDNIEVEGMLPQTVRQCFVLYQPSTDFVSKLMGANK